MDKMMLLKRSYFDDQYRAALEKHSFDHKYSTDSVIVTLSIALALYNAIELSLLITTTFKTKWRGLYFWSLTLCNFGVVLYAIGMMLLYFELCIMWLSKVVLDIGWTLLVVCQSLVLFSRLGLVVNNDEIIKSVKWMIIIDSLCLVTLTWIFDFGTTYSNLLTYPKGYFYIEHIQVTGFCLQELVISGLYVWKAIALLKVVARAHTRSMMWQLLFINVVIMAMDIALIVLQYKHLQLYQESIKVFVYSVKLKLELHILSRLVDLVHGASAQRRRTIDTLDTLDANAMYGSGDEKTAQSSGPQFGRLTSWYGSEGRGSEKISGNGRSRMEGANDGVGDFRLANGNGNGNDDDITRVVSHPSCSRFSARASGRESDMMYANMLRSMR